MAAVLAQELSKLSLNGVSSLETLTFAAQKGVQAEPFLLAHLPAILKATADKVTMRLEACCTVSGSPASRAWGSRRHLQQPIGG